MPVSSAYLTYIVDQLAKCEDVRTRRMFGGVGIYHDDAFFALIDDDQLYFKVNDATRAEFVSHGAVPFQPMAKDSKSVTLGYYTVPAEILEDSDTLKIWMRRSIAVARAAAAKKNKKSSRPARTRAARKKQ